MSVASSTTQHLDNHLGQAEFALKVASNFDCLKGTPAHEAVHAALAQVGGARTWIRQNLAEKSVMAVSPRLASHSPVERHRIVQRRMARLTP